MNPFLRFQDARLSWSPHKSVAQSDVFPCPWLLWYGVGLVKKHAPRLKGYDALFQPLSKKSVFSGTGCTQYSHTYSLIHSLIYSHLFMHPFTQLANICLLSTLPTTVLCSVGHSDGFLIFNIFHVWLNICS